MNKKVIRVYFISILIICLSIFSFSALASSLSSIDGNSMTIYNNISEIQKQLASISETVYKNKLEDKSNEESKRILEFTDEEISKLIVSLIEYESSEQLDKVQRAKLESLIIATNIVKYMDEVLIEYIDSTETYEQLHLLKVYFKLDSIFTQLTSDFGNF